MLFSRSISAAAAMAITGAGLLAMAPPSAAKSRPIVVVAEPAPAPTRRVGFGDLDLASANGQRVLNGRVAGAVRDVCAISEHGATELRDRQCRSFAWAGARPQISRAVARAVQLATNGTSSLAPLASIEVVTRG